MSHETSARGMLALLRNSSLAMRLPDWGLEFSGFRALRVEG